MKGELSIFSYLETKRLAHLAFKTWFTRRQRFSTRFFRRYSIQTAEVNRDEKESRKKVFAADKVVTECNYEQDELDRRILFEMIGERLHEDDFPEETSESEEFDDTGIDNSSSADGLDIGDTDREQALLPTVNASVNFQDDDDK